MGTNQMQKDILKEWIEVYEKPSIEVIEMEIEGILCASTKDFEEGGGWEN